MSKKEENALRQQFQQLQEQQQKKMARRKQIKEEQDKAKNSKVGNVPALNDFGVDDDLGLQVFGGCFVF